jgi:hypothetical protein
MPPSSTLTSAHYDVDSYLSAVNLAYNEGWSDGLPVIPPTEDLIRAFLDGVGLAPSDVIVEIAERGRIITAEKLAVNAVMAGCLPEYMPVLVAILEAMADPRYRFNHLASMGSPWPLVIVNGPIAKQLKINSGPYLFGPGHRANLAIARGISLVLRNCAGAKFEDAQRGQWGNPMRLVGCIAENEDLGWTPLHVQRGFRAEESTVTVLTVYPGSPVHVTVNERGRDPETLLKSVCHAMANWGGAILIRGVYVLLIGPHYVDLFRNAGWSKDDIHDYVVENAKSSVASLKERQVWGKHVEDLDERLLEIRPEDYDTYVHVLKKHPALEPYVSWPVTMEPDYDRDIDLFVVGAGGDAGGRLGLTIPNYVSTNPVSKAIRVL